MWRVWNWPHTIRYNQILIPFIFHLVLLETSHCFWQVLGSTECILRSRCLCRLTMGLVLNWQWGWFHFLKCSCSQQSCFSSPVALPPVQSQSHLNLCPFHPDLHRQLCHHHLLHWLHLLLAPLSLDPPYLSVWMGTCDPGSLPTYKIKKFRLSYSLTLWIFKVTHKSPKNYKKDASLAFIASYLGRFPNLNFNSFGLGNLTSDLTSDQGPDLTSLFPPRRDSFQTPVVSVQACNAMRIVGRIDI